MNAAERIVEAYFRHVRGAFTRTSVRGVGQVELDIVAVDPNKSPMVFSHIESAVSISSGYSKITNKPFSPSEAKLRQKMAGQRTTAGFFIEKKFFTQEVLATLRQIGCKTQNLKRILVSWEFDNDALKVLQDKGIECLTMKEIFQELADSLALETCDFDSDILRTLQLFVRAKPQMPEIYSVETIRQRKKQGR